MSKFLLLLGPSGVGKSTIIGALRIMSPKFVYISPYTTRPLRDGETDKVSVTNDEMDGMDANDELVTVNTLFGGIRYGTPRAPIVSALQVGNYPVLDWPVHRLEIMKGTFPDQLFVVYVAPPSIAVLQDRISRDGRDPDGSRFQAAKQELGIYWAGGYSNVIDAEVTSEDGNIDTIAQRILNRYLASF